MKIRLKSAVSKVTLEGTISPDVLVTTLNPDIVIIDKNSKSLNIFELTVPGETRIQTAHTLKYEKKPT